MPHAALDRNIVADLPSAFSANDNGPNIEPRPVDLTPGGATIRKRVFRPNSTCNLLATLAGIGNVEG